VAVCETRKEDRVKTLSEEANDQLQWVRRELSGLQESLQCVGETLLAAEKREDEMRTLLADVREYMTGMLTGSEARLAELALLARIDAVLEGGK